MILRPAFMAIALVFSSLSHAGSGTVSTRIDRVMLHETGFGNCMARLEKAPGSVGLNCKENWVSFSCSGDFQPKNIAAMSFSTAQLALVMDNKVNVVVDDGRKHNGYCFAKKIELLK
jgi:hypothetical protein